MQIVIPMAGKGSRFIQEGFILPKPLIPVCGVPMAKLVIENLRPSCPHVFTFICQHSHLKEYALEEKLRQWAPGSNVIAINRVTDGAACTVLLSESIIDNNQPLMIANCDQYVDTDMDAYLAKMDRECLDGLIMTMTANDRKWSFVGFDAAGRVNRVVEKEVISNEATVGIYNFRRGRDFVSGAKRMIARNLRVNNEFYVAPVYNQLIEDGKKVEVLNVGNLGEKFWGLGTPEDLKEFEKQGVL